MKMQISCSDDGQVSLSAVGSLEQVGFAACAEVGLNAHAVIEIDRNVAMIVFEDEDAAPDRHQSGQLHAALERQCISQADELIAFAIDHEDYLGLGENVVCYKMTVRRLDAGEPA